MHATNRASGHVEKSETLSAKEDEMLKRVAVLALLGVSLASAKTYSFRLSESCRAGSAQLQPGEYKLKLEGDKVILIDKKGRSIEAVAKVETADRKYNETAVAVTKAEDSGRIEWIALGGSKSRVVFQ